MSYKNYTDAQLEDFMLQLGVAGFDPAPKTLEEFIASEDARTSVLPKDLQSFGHFSSILTSSLLRDLCQRIQRLEADR